MDDNQGEALLGWRDRQQFPLDLVTSVAGQRVRCYLAFSFAMRLTHDHVLLSRRRGSRHRAWRNLVVEEGFDLWCR